MGRRHEKMILHEPPATWSSFKEMFLKPLICSSDSFTNLEFRIKLFFPEKTEHRVKKVAILLKIQRRKWKKNPDWWKKSILPTFELKTSFQAERKKSRAELMILQLEPWLEPGRLGLITNYWTNKKFVFFLNWETLVKKL